MSKVVEEIEVKLKFIRWDHASENKKVQEITIDERLDAGFELTAFGAPK